MEKGYAKHHCHDTLVVMLVYYMIETNYLLLWLYLFAGGAPLQRWQKA